MALYVVTNGRRMPHHGASITATGVRGDQGKRDDMRGRKRWRCAVSVRSENPASCNCSHA
eukprot:366070-Chlamydomonas_euryale.AAC.13